MPVLLGWYIGSGILAPLAIGAAVIIVLGLLALVISPLNLALVSCVFLLIGVSHTLYYSATFVPGGKIPSNTIVFIAFLVALAMGVAESIRVSAFTWNRQYYLPEISRSTLAQIRFLYRGGTNAAMCTIFPAYLLTTLHPATTILYKIMLLFTIVAAIVLALGPLNRYKAPARTCNLFGIALGLILPIELVLGILVNYEVVLKLPNTNAIANLPLGGLALVAFPSFLGYPVKGMGEKRDRLIRCIYPFNAKVFLSWQPSVALLGATSSLLAVLSGMSVFFVKEYAETESWIERLTFLFYTYLGLSIVSMLLLFLHSMYHSPPPRGKSDGGATHPKNLISKLSGWHALSAGRISTSVISALPLAVVLVAQDAPVVAILKLVPIVLVTMCGFIFNDIVDIDKDRIAGKNRVITRGLMSKRAAIIWCLSLATIAIFLELIFGSVASLILIVGLLIAVGAYSPISHRFPLCKGFYTAMLCLGPIALADIVGSLNVSFLVYFLAGSFISGREILLDVVDMKSDAMCRIGTVAVLLGRRIATYIAFLLMLVSLPLLAILAIRSGQSVSFILLHLASLLVLLSAIGWWRNNVSIAVVCSRYAVAVGAIALVVGTV